MNKKYKIVNSYFYDYHTLQIAIETSNLILKSLEMELKCEEESNNTDRIFLLKEKIKSRKNLIDYMKNQLENMKKTIDKFPKQLKGAEYNIFRESIVNNKPASEIAHELGYSEQYVYKIRSQILSNFKNYLDVTR